MKRFYLNMAVFCLLFWSVFGCSGDGKTGMPSPDPTPAPDAPELVALEVVSRTKVDFEFSAPVRVLSLDFDPSLEIASIEDGRTVRVRLGESLEPGLRIVADILASDPHGNTFSERVAFKKYADDDNDGGEEPESEGIWNGPPELLINELRTEASATRAEFVELRTLSAGNLAGLRVYVYRSGARAPTEFEFPPTRVEANEYVVLHLRTLENPAADAPATAHNFWVPGSASRLNKTGAVYVRDANGEVLAAVMISESPDPAWWEGASRSHFGPISEFLFERGAWKSAGGGVARPADAVITTSVGTAVTRSISRDETVNNTNTSADWYVTANNGATPGAANSPNRLP